MERVEFIANLVRIGEKKWPGGDILFIVAHSQGGGGVSRSSVFLLSYLISNGIIQLDKERNVFN